MEFENLIDFLTPYINEAKKCSTQAFYEGVLYQSMLYILVGGSVLYTMDLSTKVDPSIIFGFDNESIDNRTIPNNNHINVYKYFMSSIYNISHTCNMVYNDPALHEDNNFMNIAMSKASDGAGFYFINTSIASIMITVFPGLPSLQKADKLELKVYNIDGRLFLINYTILKKKLGMPINVYFKIINTNCPLR